MDDAREHVAAELVGAEEVGAGAAVLPGGGPQPDQEVLRVGVVGGDERGEQGGDEQECEDGEGQYGEPVAEQGAQDDGARAAKFLRRGAVGRGGGYDGHRDVLTLGSRKL